MTTKSYFLTNNWRNINQHRTPTVIVVVKCCALLLSTLLKQPLLWLWFKWKVQVSAFVVVKVLVLKVVYTFSTVKQLLAFRTFIAFNYFYLLSVNSRRLAFRIVLLVNCLITSFVWLTTVSNCYCCCINRLYGLMPLLPAEFKN